MAQHSLETLAGAILETADGMRRTGIMSDDAHAKVTMRHLGQTTRLRTALPGDAAAVARIYHQGWHIGHAAALPWLAAERPPEVFATKVPGMLGHCLVAEVCGAEVVGFAAWDGPELGQLFIEPSREATGVAAMLLAGVEGAIGADGFGEARLTCVVGNHRARAFYLRHGWADQGVEDYPAITHKGRTPVQVWRLTKRV